MEKLEVQCVSKTFDGRKVLEDVSITLREGELVSLLGVSGGGKTTLFNIISGLLTPDEGRVYLNGEDVTGQPGNISYLRPLAWEGRKTFTRPSCPAVCASGRRC